MRTLIIVARSEGIIMDNMQLIGVVGLIISIGILFMYIRNRSYQKFIKEKIDELHK